MKALIDFLCSEIDDLERKVGNEGKLSMSEIEYADKLAHLKKNLLKGEEMMEEDGYSNTGDYSNRGYNYRYDDGMTRYSRARGRMNARRDSMGRYSRGYSMANDEMVAELRELMQDAPDDRTRQEFQSFISKIERM